MDTTDIWLYAIIFVGGFKIAHEDRSPFGEPVALLSLWMVSSIAAALYVHLSGGYAWDASMRNMLALTGIVAFTYGKWREYPLSVRLV